MAFKPIRPIDYYDSKIAKKIIEFEWQWYFKPIFDILKPNSVLNDNNALFGALKSGNIYYQNEAFYSKTGRFSNKIALELERIGARYSKYGRCYRIAQTKLPNNLLWIIETTNAKVYSDVVAITKVLDTALGIIDEALKNLKIADIAEQMILDIEDRFYKNFKANRIETIQPKMSDSIAKQFSERYTDSIEFNIKKWQPEDIVKMREVVGQMAINGDSRITIANYIEQRFKVSQKKAKFLARNESKIAVNEYLFAKYESEGLNEFKWVANLDERVRQDHKDLNGVIFTKDNPPIINQKTGKRGLPGEDYNCRCTFVPVIPKTWLNQRKNSV